MSSNNHLLKVYADENAKFFKQLVAAGDQIEQLEQRLAEARALLERWQATIEDEVKQTPEEVTLWHDTATFLAR